MDAAIAVTVMRQWLAHSSAWLVICDNADDPGSLRPWVPQGPGHVIVTSRNPVWNELATPIGVNVFSRAESVALLENMVYNVSADAAGGLAEALGICRWR